MWFSAIFTSDGPTAFRTFRLLFLTMTWFDKDRPAALLRRRGLQGIFTRDTAASVSGLRSTIAPSVVRPLGVPTTIAVVAVATPSNLRRSPTSMHDRNRSAFR